MKKKENLFSWLNTTDIGGLGNSSINWHDDLLKLALCPTKSAKRNDGNSFFESPVQFDAYNRTQSTHPSGVFRTPTCLMLQDDTSLIQKIPLLGVNDTNTSWTSSMATTPADGHTLKTALADLMESDNSLSRGSVASKPGFNRQPSGAPRALFSPAESNELAVCRLSSGLDMSNLSVDLLCFESTFSMSEGEPVQVGLPQVKADVPLEVDDIDMSLVPLKNNEVVVTGAGSVPIRESSHCQQDWNHRDDLSATPHGHFEDQSAGRAGDANCSSSDAVSAGKTVTGQGTASSTNDSIKVPASVEDTMKIINDLKQMSNGSVDILAPSQCSIIVKDKLTPVNSKTATDSKLPCTSSLIDNELSIFFASPVDSSVVKHKRRSAPKRRAHRQGSDNSLEAIDGMVSVWNVVTNSSSCVEVIEGLTVAASPSVINKAHGTDTGLGSSKLAVTAKGNYNTQITNQSMESTNTQPTITSPHICVTSSVCEINISSPATVAECSDQPLTATDVKLSDIRSLCTSTPKAGGRCKTFTSPSITPLGSFRPVVHVHTPHTTALPSSACLTPVNCLRFLKTPEKNGLDLNNYDTPLRPEAKITSRCVTDLCRTGLPPSVVSVNQLSTGNVELLTPVVRSSPIITFGTNKQTSSLTNASTSRPRRKFIYPTPAQIADGCPPRVFSFNRGSPQLNNTSSVSADKCSVSQLQTADGVPADKCSVSQLQTADGVPAEKGSVSRLQTADRIPADKCSVSQLQTADGVPADKCSVSQLRTADGVPADKCSVSQLQTADGVPADKCSVSQLRTADGVPADKCSVSQLQTADGVPADKCTKKWLPSTEYYTGQCVASDVEHSLNEFELQTHVPHQRNAFVSHQCGNVASDEHSARSVTQNNMTFEKDSGSIGFMSAAGKHITVSDKSKAKADKLMEQVRQECFDLELITYDDSFPLSSLTQCQPQVRNVDESLDCDRVRCINSSVTEFSSTTSANRRIGFSSASGKSLCVKKENLLKAQLLMEAVYREEHLLEACKLGSNKDVHTARECVGGKIVKLPRPCDKVNIDKDHATDLRVNVSGDGRSDCMLSMQKDHALAVASAVDCGTCRSSGLDIIAVGCTTSQHKDLEPKLSEQHDLGVFTCDLTTTQRAEVDMMSLLAVQNDLFETQLTSCSQHSLKSETVVSSAEQCSDAVKINNVLNRSTQSDGDTDLLQFNGENMFHSLNAIVNAKDNTECQDVLMEAEDTMKEGVSIGWNTQDVELDKAMVLFDLEALQKCNSLKDSKDSPFDLVKNDIPTASVFQTARGNAVKISVESLNKARNLLKEDILTTVDERSSGNEAAENCKSNVPTASVFQTARGNAVKISVESLNKARNLLNDEILTTLDERTSETEAAENCKSNASTASVFQTARGNAVKISVESLNKARNLLKDDMLTALDERTNRTEVGDNCKSNVPTASVFQTARGNAVKISVESLNKARNLLKDEILTTLDERTSETEAADNCESNASTASVFQTARGNAVKISVESLNKARNLLKDDMLTALDERTNRTKVGDNCKSNVPTASVFQTARGNAVKISVESLNKARNLLKDEILTTLDERTSETEAADNCESNASTASVFQTARGNAVKISVESLNKARNLLKDDMLTALDERTNRTKVGDNCKSNVPTASVFQTARGNAVKISVESLNKARNLLKDEILTTLDERTSDTEVADNCKSNVPTASVFQTARGNTAKISVESLNKARNLLKDDILTSIDERSSGNEVADNCKSNVPTASVFQTARGSAVKISVESLNKARNLLKDDMLTTLDEQSSGPDVVPTYDNMQRNEFTSATKKVLIEPEDWALSSLCVIGRRPDTDENKATGMLQTAKGKTVAVSSESLSVIKKLSNARSSYETGDVAIITKCTEHVDADATMLQPDFPNLNFKKSRSLQHSLHASDSLKTTFHMTNQEEVTVGKKMFANFVSDSVNKVGNECSVCSTAEKMKNNQEIINADANLQPLEAESTDKDVPSIGVSSSNYLRVPLTSVPEKFSADRSQGHSIMKPLNSDCLFDVPQNIASEQSGCSEVEPTEFKTQQPSRRSVCQFFTPYKRSVTKTACKSTAVMSAVHALKPPLKVCDQFGSGVEKVIITSQAASSTCDRTFPLKSNNVSCNVIEHDELVSRTGLLPESTDVAMVICKNESTAPDNSGHATECKIVGTGHHVEYLQAKQAQLHRIALKQHRSDIAVNAGSYWLTRKSAKHGRISMKEAVDGRRPARLQPHQLYACGVSKETQAVTAASAEKFCFKATDWHSVIDLHVGDNALLIFNDSGLAGKEEFSNALMDTTGVVPKLISPAWVYNHYRWIIWKLAAMEVAFPQYFGGRCLTPHNVMLQLKYRYDVEIDNSQRSALKKIFEQDDTTRKNIVLCVSAIQNEHSVELTDGWYSIQTLLDAPLGQLVQNGQICMGTKLYIYGADLSGMTEACSPLEAPDNLKLKIYANSTRRSLWNAKLGYQPSLRPPIVSLSSLLADGGPVPGVDVVITRVYPLQFLEKLADGSTITRSECAEQRAAQSHNSERQHKLELLYTQLQREEQLSSMSRVSGRLKSNKSDSKLSFSIVNSFSSIDELYEEYVSTTDPDLFETWLQPSQLQSLRDHIAAVQQQKEFDLQERVRSRVAEMGSVVPMRNITPFVRVQIAGCNRVDIDTKSKVILTVWRPTEEVLQFLHEGARLLIFNLMAKSARGRGVCLSTTRFTRYDQSPVDDNLLDLVYEPREATKFTDVCHHGSAAQSVDIDTVGLVVDVSVSLTSSTFITMVYLADCDDNFLAVKFYGKLEVYAVDNVLCVGAVVACCNLQCRSSSMNGLPNVVASEMSTFTVKTPLSHLRSAMTAMQSKLKSCTHLVLHLQASLVQVKLTNENVNCRNTTTTRDNDVTGTRSLQLSCNTSDVTEHNDVTGSTCLVQVNNANNPRRTPGLVNKSLRHSFNTSDITDTSGLSNNPRRTPGLVNKSLRHSFNTSDVTDTSVLSNNPRRTPGVVNKSLRHSFNTSDITDTSGLSNNPRRTPGLVNKSLRHSFNTSDVTDTSVLSNNPRRTPGVVNKSLRHSFNTSDVTDTSGLSNNPRRTPGLVNKSLRHSFNTSDVTDTSGLPTPSTVTVGLDRPLSQSRKRTRLGSGVSVGRKSLKLSTVFDV